MHRILLAGLAISLCLTATVIAQQAGDEFRAENALRQKSDSQTASDQALVPPQSEAPVALPSDTSTLNPSMIPRQLRVATRQVPPFAMLNEDGQWEGISIDLFREVKAALEEEAEHEIDIEFVDMDLEPMLTAVENNTVDLAAAAITVNYDRETRMDFTHPFHNSGLSIAVGSEEMRSGWSGIIDAVFSPTFFRIIVGLLILMLFSAILMYLFERKHNEEEFSKNWITGVGSGLWWAAVTLTTVGYGDKAPKSLPGRLIGLIWMFAGLFIIASFTASVTSVLTVGQLRSRINGPQDLARVKVATVEGSTSADYLWSRHIMYEKFDSVQEALRSLDRKECDAVVYDAPILRYEVFHNYSGRAFVLPDNFQLQDYAFALPSDSRLREPINRVLLRRISSPAWQDVLASYFGNSF